MSAILSFGLVAAAAPPTDGATTVDPIAGLDRTISENLNRCRDGILAPTSQMEERVRWVEQLFSYDYPEARTLARALLERADRPDVQRAVCMVIIHHARSAPDRLDANFVEPLIARLDCESDDLRSTVSRALAGFPGPDVPRRLGALAASADAPLRKRLAAIDALAPNIHRREVVAELIDLLDVGVGEVTQRVAASLEPAAKEPLGSQPQAWRDWWEKKKALSQEAWLADQTQNYRRRLDALENQVDACRAEARRRNDELARRVQEFQRDLFRALGAEQEQAQLVEWLDDPLQEVQLAALAFIKAQIADEGRRPGGDVLDALLRLLSAGPAPVRREVLLIVQNLNDPAVVAGVLELLEIESDPATRHATLQAIGKLNRPEAAGALIREIAAPNIPRDCVREAALALRQIAAKAKGEPEMQGAVSALKMRYAATPQEDDSVRGALLSAMAGVADPSFAAEFLDAVESESAAVIRPAIEGLRAIGNTSKLARLRDHAANADPLVRLAAIEAVGSLAREAADLECLLARLNPATEPNELAREAAWRGVRDYLRDKPVAARIEASERLRDIPELEAAFLAELVEYLQTVNGHSQYLETVRRRLAEIEVGQGNFVAAATQFGSLYRLQRSRGASAAGNTGLEWFDAALRAFPQQEPAKVLEELLTSAGQGKEPADLLHAVRIYFESDEAADDPPRGRSLVAHLRTARLDGMPPEWHPLLNEIDARLANPQPSKPESEDH